VGQCPYKHLKSWRREPRLREQENFLLSLFLLSLPRAICRVIVENDRLDSGRMVVEPEVVNKRAPGTSAKFVGFELYSAKEARAEICAKCAKSLLTFAPKSERSSH
jgi:hypothetical protein